MNQLSQRDRELVAIGAAIASNCIPCIEHHVPEARKAGLTDEQIGVAVRVADSVRQVPARKVLDTAMRLLSETSSAPAARDGCGGEPAQSVANTGACCG